MPRNILILTIFLLFSAVSAETGHASPFSSNTHANVTTMATGNHGHSANGEMNEKDYLWDLLIKIEEQLFSRFKQTKHMESIDRLMKQTCEGGNPEQYRARAVHAEAIQEKKDLGLSIRGAYTSKDIKDDTGEASSYVELSWDVLRGGYQDNRYKSEELLRKARAIELRGKINQQKQTLRCRRYQFAQSLVGLKSALLTLKFKLMEPVYRIERRAYIKGWSYLDDFLVSETDLLLAQREIKYLHSTTDYDNTINTIINPPLIDIEMQKITDAIRNDPRYSQVTHLEKESLHFSERNNNDNRLRFFLRQGIEVDNSGSSDLSAGVRFTIPLEKRKKDPIHFKILELDEKQRIETWERQANARAAYAEVREQMERVLKQQYSYLRARERVRRSLAERRLSTDDGLPVAIMRVRSLLDSAIELAQAKEELYRRINEVFLAANIDYQPEFIKIIHHHDDEYRARTGKRMVYVWSSVFNHTPNDQIIDFMQAKGIGTVTISAGKKTNREKLKDFTVAAKGRGLIVETITGSNKWIFPENHKKAAAQSAITAELTGKIHLDIEPHTLDSYRQHREEYLDHYLAMLGNIRKATMGHRLSIAVPMHWPANYYSKAANYADAIYIMAYGTNDEDKLIKRLDRSMRNIPKDKITIVLRIKDFEDEWEMEKMFDTLGRRLGIQRFGIHQFREYLHTAGKEL
jgi:hypothetical protein